MLHDFRCRLSASIFLGWLLCVAVPAVGNAQAQPDAGAVDANQANNQDENAARFAVSVAHGESSNLGRIPGGQRGSFDSIGTLIDLARKSSRANLALNGDLEYRTYSRQFDNETIGTLDGTANVTIVPQRFVWLSQATYGQGRTNPLRARGPGNRESVDVIATGPQIHLPAGRRNELTLGSNISSRRFEVSKEFDSDVVLNEIGLYHQANRTTAVSMIGQASRIKYKLNVAGYDIDSLRLRYQKELARGDVLAEVGRNKLIFKDFQSEGPLAQLTWTRALTPRSRLGFSFTRQLVDLGGLFALTTGQYGANADYLLSPNPLEQKRAGVAYTLSLHRVSATLQAASVTERYEQDKQADNDGSTTSLNLFARLNPRLGFDLVMQQTARSFTTLARTDREGVVRFGLARQLGQHFVAEARVERTVRTGEDAFSETVYRVSLAYTPGGRYRPGNLLN